MLYKVVLTSESVYETIACDHSNESYILCWYCSCHTVYHAVYLYKVVLSFNSVEVCDHSNELY